LLTNEEKQLQISAAQTPTPQDQAVIDRFETVQEVNQSSEVANAL